MEGPPAIIVVPPKEPYRATKLWFESVALFRTGVPIGKNRYRWKTHENCFVASEAVTWFHTQLEGTFRSGISRTQTSHLLRKFYKEKVFIPVGQKEEASGPNACSNIVVNENEFKDNGQLYKLTTWDVNEEYQRIKASTNMTSNNGKVQSGSGAGSFHSQSHQAPQAQLQKFTVVIKLLEQVEVYNIWKNVFIERFVHVHGSDILEFLNPTSIHGDRIFYNMTKISQFGIVISTKPEDDLPSWLIHAMKCLANWPNNHVLEQGIPSYPGFENDVFKLLLDYFEPHKKSDPLLTTDLYDAFITSFIRAELFDFNCRLYGNKSNAAPTAPTTTGRRASISNTDEHYPMHYSDSLENLLLDILTPRTEKEKSHTALHKERSFVLKPRRIFGNTQTQIKSPETNPPVPSPMQEKSYDLSRYSTNLPVTNPETQPIYYETAFTSVRTPITRIISKTELQHSKIICQTPETEETSTPVKNPTSFPYAYENPVLELSPPDLINHPKYSKVSKKLNPPASGMETSYSCLNYSVAVLPTTSNFGPVASRVAVVGALKKSSKSQISRSYSASHLSDQVKDRSPYQPQAPKQLSRGFRMGGTGKNNTSLSLANGYANSPSRSARRTLDFYYGADACVPGLMTQQGKNLAIVSFRLLTLLLPPKNRRHLQLLLRCMTKMVRNEKLLLDIGMTTRAIVINSLFRAILSPANTSEFDELLALRIVTFLVDNDKEIFNPADEKEFIEKKVEEIVKEQQIHKIPIEESETKENIETSFSACKRITLDEYEEEKLLGSTSKSLRQLLETIDTLEDEKLRRKKLRDFRNEYPHIYADRFGEIGSPGDVGSIANKKRESNREWKAFRLFKSLRL